MVGRAQSSHSTSSRGHDESACRLPTHQSPPGAFMSIELPKEAHKEAIASIERYFRENMEEKIGNVAASGLLGFFLEEVGPSIYNKAIADVQERMQMRISELDIEVHEDEFQYWRKYERQSKPRK
jgi:uncharacterized protein (DUF2164 family)